MIERINKWKEALISAYKNFKNQQKVFSLLLPTMTVVFTLIDGV